MQEQATDRMTVRASPERCLAVALEVEQYPEWAADIKEVEVLDRDAEGRPQRVRFISNHSAPNTTGPMTIIRRSYVGKRWPSTTSEPPRPGARGAKSSSGPQM